MSQQDAQKSNKKVFPLRSDDDTPKALDEAISLLEVGFECYPKQGLVQDLCQQCLALLQVIRSGRTDKQIGEAVTDILSLRDNMIRLVAESTNQGERSQIDTLQVEVSKLQTNLDGAKAESTKLTKELEQIRSYDWSQISDLAATLRTSQRSIRESLVAAHGRARLEAELAAAQSDIAALHNEKRKHIDEDIGNVNNFLSTFERLIQAHATKDIPTAATAITQVQGEINRRLSWIRELREQQQIADDELETARSNGEEIQNQIKFVGQSHELHSSAKTMALEITRWQKYIDSLLALETPVKERLRSLEAFTRAADQVSRGIGDEIFSESLPEIPELPAPVKDETPVFVEEDEEDSPNTVPVPSRPPNPTLTRLGKTHGLTDKAVFVISLYDLLPERDSQPGTKRKKGLISVLAAAQRSGILNAFEWNSPRDVLLQSQINNPRIQIFLHYNGTYKGATIYRRTEKPLPWNINEFFTPEQKVRFTEQIETAQSTGK